MQEQKLFIQIICFAVCAQGSRKLKSSSKSLLLSKMFIFLSLAQLPTLCMRHLCVTLRHVKKKQRRELKQQLSGLIGTCNVSPCRRRSVDRSCGMSNSLNRYKIF